MEKMFLPNILFEADKGSGSAAPVASDTPPDATPLTDTPQADDKAKVVFTPEQQAAIDKIIGGARTKAREQAKVEFEAAQAEAKKKADEEAKLNKAKEEKRFQDVIDGHEAKIAEIEPALEKATKALEATSKVVEDVLNKMVESLGEQAKIAIEALPGEPDLLAKLAWLQANEELFKSKAPAPKGTPPRQGIPSQALQKKNEQEAPPVVVNF